MLDLIFDTETTGKYEFKKGYNDPCQPSIVQLAAILVEGSFIRASMNLIVIPNKKCEAEAAKVHGISEELIGRCGVPMNVAVPMFSNLARKADRLVAHNINFDINIVSAAFCHLGANPEALRNIPRVCTMKSSMYVVNLPPTPGKREPKWPKLIEAYKSLVDESGFDGAHDAMVDVLACWKVKQALEERNIQLKE